MPKVYVGYPEKQSMAVELTVGHGCLPAGSFGLVLTLQPLLDVWAAGYVVAILQTAAQGGEHLGTDWVSNVWRNCGCPGVTSGDK